MTDRPDWPKVAVIGAGAVGGYFGGLLAHAGAPVVMVGRQAFVDAVRSRGLLLDTLQFQTRVHVEASTDLSAVGGAELILFCVKSTDNGATAQKLALFLSPQSTVISLQNGVDNAEQIRAATNIEVLPAVVYVAASCPEPGSVKHVSRGDLVLGSECTKTRELAGVFRRAGIPSRISDNIDGELWTKLIWNCALNAISALGRAKYGRIAKSPAARKLVRSVVAEVLNVAHAAGVVLPSVPDADTALDGAMEIATHAAEAFSSTAQDIHRGKRTEIDSLNGYISRKGTELGVPTPLNDALSTLVKLLERSDSDHGATQKILADRNKLGP